MARRLLELITAHPGLAVSDLARRLDVDPGAVHYHLRRFETAELAHINGRKRSFRVYPGKLANDTLDAFGS